MFDHQSVKLGARQAPFGSLDRNLKLANYLDVTLTEFIPRSFDLSIDVYDHMDLNDVLGDCVVATQAKMVRSWTQNATGTGARVDALDILQVYKDGAGYDPDDPSTDQGWYLLPALRYWQRIGIGGHKIGAFTQLNPKHHAMVKAAAYLFGGLYIALELPKSAQTQDVWDAVDGASGKPGSWGGHCVPIQGINDVGPVVLTWGRKQQVTWAFLDKYCSEMYAIISPDHFNGTKTVAGLDLASLTADLAVVKA